jgi:tetratricopeptide (TPR) repeat protein
VALLRNATLLGLLACLAGCPQPSQSKASPAPPKATPTDSRSTSAGAPLSAEELEALWKATGVALESGQVDVLNRKLDLERFSARAALCGGLSADLQKALHAALSKDPPSLEGLLKNLPPGGSISFLRGVPGDPARIRLRRSWEGGFDYVDLLVERAGDDYRVVDLEQWGTEPLSLNVSSTLARGADLGREQLVRLQEARFQASAGKHAQALETLAGLPATTAALPSVWVQKLASCAALGSESLTKARAEFDRACADTPARLLWSISHDTSRGAYPAALKLIDELDQRVGGDPHLWLWRAICHQGTGDLAQAKQSLVKAAELLPEDVDVQFELIDFALSAQDWALVAQTMTLCEERFGIKWPQDLATAPDYESFRTFAKSKEYAAWRKR